LETMVALGAAIDLPFLHGRAGVPIVAPADATALVMACATIATAEADHPVLEMSRRSCARIPGVKEQIDGTVECALQLVRLGADPLRRLNVGNASESPASMLLRHVGFDGKTALELAQMAKRPELVELMERHVRYSPEERANLVHCRCGSRLPWKECHSTGIGQPAHYRNDPEFGVVYRVSPLAKCPCGMSAKRHYDCCWRDTSMPVYLVDESGGSLRMEAIPQQSVKFQLLQMMRGLPQSQHIPDDWSQKDFFSHAVALLRAKPTMLSMMFSLVSPKTQMGTWDNEVYAGCLERLEKPFFWKDVHWILDEAELLHLSAQWNRALQQYCDDVGLQGDKRERVVARHTANPCAPCGRVGCDAFEREVREFRRCSRCKAIAYCGRDCQKLDWADHRKVCTSQDKLLSGMR
jgi:MYND finger